MLAEAVTLGPSRPGLGEVGVVVRAHGIGRRYADGTIALDGIDLEVAAGQSLAIVGRSGSGKSTLLNILGLLDAPSVGTLSLLGRDAGAGGDRGRSDLRSGELAFVFQRSHLLPALSVRRNVELGLRYSVHGSRQTITQRVDDALARVGLTGKANALARTLSGGEMQRVAIARALVRPARLWLADEPTGNLDSAQAIEIIDDLRTHAADAGAALVVVTHDPDVAERLDRIVTINDGRLVSDTLRWAPDPPEPGRSGTPTSDNLRIAAISRFRRTVQSAVESVSVANGRTNASLIASALAVALTITALGLSQSGAAQVSELFDAQRAKEVTASVAYDDPDTAQRSPLRMDALTSFPGVTGAELWTSFPPVQAANGMGAPIQAEAFEVDRAPAGASASTITWAPGTGQSLDAGEVVLGETLAERLGVTQLDLAPEITVNGAPLRVVGIVTSKRSGTAAGAVFAKTGALPGAADSLAAGLYVSTSPGAARPVAERLQALVDPYADARLVIDPVPKPDSYAGQLSSSVAAALAALAALASLAGLGTVIFVNLLSITARRAEIGVRRAFGARRSEIAGQISIECTTLATLGAVIGLGVGFIAIMLVTSLAHWHPVFDPVLLAVPLAGALVFGGLSGLAPALNAARIEPAEAVRT